MFLVVDSMILLGSIQRYELQAQIEKQIGRERKLMPINPSEAPSIEVVDTETTNNANNASNGHSSTAPVNKDQVNIQVHDPVSTRLCHQAAMSTIFF